MIRKYTIPVTTTGSAGSASGSEKVDGINGFLLGVYLDFAASAPATTDTTIATDNPAQTLLTVTDSATDTYVPVRVQAKDATGAAISGVYEMYPLDGMLKVSLAQCNAITSAVVAYAYVLEA